MNILEAEVVSSPTGLDENTAKFTIDDPLSPFTLHTITEIGKEYTLSFYSKRGDSTDHKILVAGKSFDVTSKWEKHVVTFTAKAKQVDMYFQSNGVYYVYHSKLESGNRAMDWTVAPEDTEETLNDLNNAVSNLKLSITKESLIATIGTHYVTDEAFGKYKSEVSLALTKDSIIATVGDYYVTPDGLSGMQSQITQNADSISSLVTADSNLQTQITQTAQSISTKVEKSGVISAINQTAESVKISASKITLAGATIADSFTATNLTITGNSVFKGKLEGATGDFSGKITASSGKIAGFEISGSSLVSSNLTLGIAGLTVTDAGSSFRLNYNGFNIYEHTSSSSSTQVFGIDKMRNTVNNEAIYQHRLIGYYWKESNGYMISSSRTLWIETGIRLTSSTAFRPMIVIHGDLHVLGELSDEKGTISKSTGTRGTSMFSSSS